MGKVTNFAKIGNFIASLCKEFVTPPWFTGKAKQNTVLFFFVSYLLFRVLEYQHQETTCLMSESDSE